MTRAALVKAVLGCGWAALTTAALSTGLTNQGHVRAYLLRARYRAGETHSYRVLTTIQGMTTDKRAIGLQFDVGLKVMQTKANRSTIRLTFNTPESMGHALPIKLGPSTITVDQYNRPVANSHSGQVLAMFPGHSVRVGDKWTGVSNLMITSKSGAMVSTTYKLDGVKSDRGRNIAVLSMKMGGLAPGEGSALVDLADGALLSCVENVITRPKGAGPFPVQIQLRRLR